MDKDLSTYSSNILKDGNSINFKTGTWRNITPKYNKDKCKNCMLCVPYCPEDCIKQKDGIIEKIDLDFCKGCGICAKVCPFKAIDILSKEENYGN